MSARDYELSGERPPVSGELNYGGILPGWQRPVIGECLAWNGQLDCTCGNCAQTEPPPVRHEDIPELTPGWTVQKARQPN